MRAPSWFQKLRRRRKKEDKKQSPCRGQEGFPAAAADGVARTSASSPNKSCPSRQCQAPVVPSSPEPAACAVSPNRASYYFPSADRARQDGGLPLSCAVVVARRDDADAATAALDVRVDVVHRRAGERRRLGGLDAPPGTPELKLRPIVTTRREVSDDGAGSTTTTTTSAATTPSTRARGFHVKPAGRRRRRRDHDGSARKDHNHQKAATGDVASSPSQQHDGTRRRHDHDGSARKDHPHEKAASGDVASSPSQQHGGTRRRQWLYESLVVVKASWDPETELAESMAEMVVANGIRSSEDLEELLACYLALNAAEHHRAVVAAFRRVWFLLDRQMPVHVV